MERLIEFITNHPILVGAFVLTGVMLVRSLIQARIAGYKTLTPQDAVNLINRRDAFVLDIREANEFKEGHIQGAYHIPLSALEKRINELEKHKGRPVLVTCQTGNRSSSACNRLVKSGFDEVFDLRGGVLSWRQDKLPLQKK